MASRNSPARMTLAMMKGKPITTSVPSIRYHASDDELEELYPSTDEEKQTPESEKSSPKSSPSKTGGKEPSEKNGSEEAYEKRSASMDGSLSEGTPPSDPWKMFSDFRGKLTKTFEEKLSEIKSDKRKKLKRRSGGNSSFSDSEDLGEVTPTEDFIPEKQESGSTTTGIRRRSQSSRFAGFSNIKTGLKAKNSEEDNSVESGIEAAELADENITEMMGGNVLGDEEKNDECDNRTKALNEKRLRIETITTNLDEPAEIISQLKRQLFYQLFAIPVVLFSTYYVLPLPDYLIGCLAGVFLVVSVQKFVSRVKKLLNAPVVDRKIPERLECPIVEIPAAKEHAVFEKFEGWLNELPYDYDPDNYHVARTNSVMFKLEADSLRIMETRTRIPKRAVWNEPQHVPKFTRKRVYSLVGAKVELLPEGLTRRRRWSKKYPICVTFRKEGIIENVDLNTGSDDETQKTDSEKEKMIFEEGEDEDEDDDEESSKLKDKKKDVFADCRDADEDDEDEISKLKIYVFARTDRQKEDWYRRLTRGTGFGSKRNSISSQKDITPSSNPPSIPSTSADTKNSNFTANAHENTSELSYSAYMSRYTDAQSTPTSETGGSLAENEIVWLNALLGRILFDMHKSPDTINLIQEKIQRKLSNIKLPYFMESLLISELVIGQGAPVIHKATKPILDEHGLSVDLDITYEGCFTMTIETKLNLMKLTRAGSVSGNTNDIVNNDKPPQPARSPMFDSDVEDSPETSTEEEDNTTAPPNPGSRESTPTQSSGRKFLSMVDKLAANRYFQSAAELSYVRRAMEGLSNTEIRLMVNVSSIKGCLTVNIPPPPSDRIWYGFKPVPRIILTTKPAVGERAVNIGYVTKWIETKLLKEFERVVVLPNMDDLMVSLCPNYPFHTA